MSTRSEVDFAHWQGQWERKGSMARNRVRNHVNRMFKEQGGKCYYCGNDMVLPEHAKGNGKFRMATFDHVIPASKGGTYALSNGVCACRDCNSLRGDMDFECFVANFKEVRKQRHERRVERNAKRTEKAVASKEKNAFMVAYLAEVAGCLVRDLCDFFEVEVQWEVASEQV